MLHYIAWFDDDNYILAQEVDIDRLISDYLKTHKYAKLESKTEITKPQYIMYGRMSRLEYYLYMQGDPMKPMSRGKKNLIARMKQRNIP